MASGYCIEQYRAQIKAPLRLLTIYPWIKLSQLFKKYQCIERRKRKIQPIIGLFLFISRVWWEKKKNLNFLSSKIPLEQIIEFLNCRWGPLSNILLLTYLIKVAAYVLLEHSSHAGVHRFSSHFSPCAS